MPLFENLENRVYKAVAQKHKKIFIFAILNNPKSNNLAKSDNLIRDTANRDYN
jgi:hypothetical protein